MFDMLLESGHRPSIVPSWGKGVALTLHLLVLAALWRTPASSARVSTPTAVTVIWPEPVTGEHIAGPTMPGGGDPLPIALAFPPLEIPAGIEKALAAPVPVGVGYSAPVGGPSLLPDSGVYPPTLVQQLPELLSAPPPAYPPLLRAAGVQGRVMVAAVVDTLGEAESGSVRIVLSDNPGFDAAALATVRAARFRPARVYGRAVRVLVAVPVVFRLN